MLAKQLLNHRYQLLERLAENAGQQTWLAIDCENEPHDYVVVKLLAMNPQMQWEHAKLLEREAQILGKLDHPYIPKYRDYFMVDQVSGSRFSWLCLVQNQVPGKSLQQLLDQGYRFTQVEVEAIASEVLSILSYLHSFNPPILHRDIKPSNLMRDEEGHIYLIDFGAVQEQAALEGVTFTVIGTYGYVPMEQFGGRAVPSSDLYALGASLIHLLTGVSPADLPQVNGRIEFASSVGIDPALVNWIRKLTEPNVDDRLPTADRALDALRNRSSLNLPLLKGKPTGSKIQLQKSIDRLDITIPRRNRHALNLYNMGGLMAGFFQFLIRWPRMMEDLRQGEILGSSSVLTWYSLILGWFLIFISMVWLPVFSYTVISANLTHFTMRRKLFGFTYWKRCKQITNIRVDIGSDLFGTSTVKIHISNQMFCTNPMAKVEQQWLMQEINDWIAVRGMYSSRASR